MTAPPVVVLLLRQEVLVFIVDFLVCLRGGLARRRIGQRGAAMMIPHHILDCG